MFQILLFSSFLQAAPTFVQAVNELYAHPETKNIDGTCDSEFYRTMKLKIAEDLDARVANIRPPQNQEKSILETDRRPGWQSFTRSWSRLARDRFLAQDKSADAPEWYRLLSQFQSLLADDQDRIVSWKNPDMSHDLGPLIERLTMMMQMCVAGGSCGPDSLNEEERTRVNMMEFYGHYTRKIFYGPEEKRKDVAREFLKRLAVDADSYQTKHLGYAVDKETQTIYVPLLAPQFADKTSKLEQLFSGVWSTMGIKIEIQWLSEKAVNMFEVLLGDFGGRPFVATDRRQMIMPPGSSAMDFSHEFGHVLGLPDEYYTRWQPRECEYLYEYSNTSLMSNHHAGGVVQRHHIESLKQTYFGKE